VLLDANSNPRDLFRENVDAVIRWGQGISRACRRPACSKKTFFRCVHRSAGRPYPIREPADLRRHTLLHLEYTSEHGTWPDWQMWLAATGVYDVDTSRGVWFSQMSIAYRRRCRAGVALTTRAIAADELAAAGSSRLSTSVSTRLTAIISVPPGTHLGQDCRLSRLARGGGARSSTSRATTWSARRESGGRGERG